ncbi:MAG: DUF2177 family protein [Woeseiaceae bacterium]|nr:DUF2177 family protein [Woeseiaceae bacterium]
MSARSYFAVIASFIVIDLAWIGLVLIDYYEATIGSMMRETANVAAAAIFYLAYAAGIVHLAVVPAQRRRTLQPAIVNGALLGALAYGTYTVTNYSILEGWTIGLVVSDSAWGSFLTAACAGLGYLADRGPRD